MTTGCPDSVEFEAFAAGALDAANSDRVGSHVAACAACRASYEKAVGDDPLVRALRSASKRAAPRASNAQPMEASGALGRYRVVRQLGEGAMGVVYEAEQLRPTRAVALKVMRPGPGGEAARRRFEFESAALARLAHPAIARIYDAGAFSVGGVERPFFAMELVRGRTLDAYVEAVRPDADARLKLFAALCDGVDYAHRKGVVHRDLKPSNILVGDDGAPKIVDFGVASLVDEDGFSGGATRTGAPSGTPAYMSPERLAGDRERCDTRVDVYALGVVLCELLCGRRPYEGDDRGYVAAAKAIADRPPRLPGSVDPAFKGDADAIVAKAIAADPDARYASAAALAADVRRSLAREPVSARPPGVGTLLRQFARRHRVVVAAAAAFTVALVAGVVVSLSLLIRAQDAENDARLAADVATSREAEAVAEAERAERVTEFLQEVLTRASPVFGGKGEATTVVDAILTARKRVGPRLKDDPRTEASVRHAIGSALGALGRPEVALEELAEAAELLRRVEGPRSARLGAVLDGRAKIEAEQGDLAKAETSLEEAVACDVPDGDGPFTRARMTYNLGVLRFERGRLADSEVALRAAIDAFRATRGSTSAAAATAGISLAWTLIAREATADASTTLEDALSAARAIMGDAHPYVRSGIHARAALLEHEGRLDVALPAAREAFGAGNDAGNVPPGLLLASLQRRTGDGAEAARTCRAVRRLASGKTRLAVADAAAAFEEALVELDSGEDEAAAALYDEGLASLKRATGGSPTILRAAAAAIGALAAGGRAEWAAVARTELLRAAHAADASFRAKLSKLAGAPVER